MKIHWPLSVVLVLLTIAAAGSMDSHAVGPLALQTGRFDLQVREDFFAGFAGNQAAFERAMNLCERTLQKDPNHPEALVWHGSGLLFRAGQAFGSGKAAQGEELWARGLDEMDRAVGFAPNDVAVLIPRGATLLEVSRATPSDVAKPLLERAIADYEKVHALQQPYFATLSPHARGELLFGLAEGLHRLGEAATARKYFQQVLDEAEGSGRVAHARALLAGETPKQMRCVGCH
jgi:tetratricopeptide (TPR) repeat protein